MGRGHASITGTVRTEDMHHFFDMKVAGVRASTAEAPPPSFNAASLGVFCASFVR